MTQATSRGALVICALGLSVSLAAQEPTATVATEGAVLRMHYATFDPMTTAPAMSPALVSHASDRLWIVQFAGTPTQAGRDAVAKAGGEIHRYLPDNAYVVRMGAAEAEAVGGVASVRWVGRYHPAYRLPGSTLLQLQAGNLPTARYNIVVVDKHQDKPALAAAIQALGGVVNSEETGSILFSATLTDKQLLAVAHLDQVLWADEWSAAEDDMDNARIQGGGNYVEAQAGYTGTGVNAHIYEGIEATHQDFTGGATNVRSSGGADTHGHCTAGIVFGNGTSNPAVRGMAPDAGKFFTQYSSVSGSRWQVISDLVNIYDVSHTTASWGNTQTTVYTSVSSEADDIIFDHDIAWTQSQSNTHNQNSRPQAWAKNIFSIGAVQHFDNSNPNDDSWAAGGGSTGPAADGRIKPTLSAYYDAIGTSDRTGSAGYSSGNWYASFGGTSGATPIVAGHNVLAIQMFADQTGHAGEGPFGNPLRNPSGSIHDNRPHFTTLKALQVISARQWTITPTTTDNTRTHVGWGFPNLQTMWDLRDKTFIVDEYDTDLLTSNGQIQRYDIAVASGEPAFRAVLNYAEPAANPSANPTLINNLSLRVTDPSGTIYWGNNGLLTSNWSSSGGSEDNINPIECVYVQNPASGQWVVEVIATAIVMDNHVETAAVDADFGLVVTGGQPLPPTSALFSTFGAGCPGSPNTVTPCTENNPTGGTLTNVTNNLEYGIIPSGLGASQLTSFEIYTRSTGGTVTIPAHIYPVLGTTPIASTTMTVGPTAGFYTATFPAPVSLGTTVFIAIDLTAGNVLVPNLTSGTTGAVFSRTPPGGWAYDPTVNRVGYRVFCTAGTVYDVPALGNVGNPQLGSTYDVTLSDALASTGAFVITGFSDSTFNGTPLPTPLPGAPGCDLQVSADATILVFTTATGTAMSTFAVPSGASWIGFNLYHQWAVLDTTVNQLGIVVSNAGKARLGN